MPPDDLQSHGQARLGESARDDTGRLAREVEGICERGPVHPIVLRVRIGQILPGHEGGDRHGRRHQKVIGVVEQVHLTPQFDTGFNCIGVPGEGQLPATLCYLEQARIHLGA